MKCKYIENCSFFQAFASRESFIWKAMIKSYCDDGIRCARHKTYEIEGFKNLPERIMPSGTYASKAFLSFP